MNLSERDKLIIENQGLVKKIAFTVSKNLPPSSFEFDDLIGWGNIGLLEAASSYDCERYEFHVWAFLRIRGAMIDGMRSMDMFPRQIYGVRRNMINQSEELCSSLGRFPTHDEIAEALDISSEEYRVWSTKILQMEYMSAETSREPDEIIASIDTGVNEFREWESSSDILEAVRLLRYRERIVIYYTYWVGLTQSEIADIMGIQPTRVHQIKQDAIKALRERLDNYGDGDGED